MLPRIRGVAMRTCSQARASSPPASQNRISRSASLSGRKMMIAETIAPRKAFTATPASSRVAIEKCPPATAMPYTRNAAAIAPAKAKTGSARKNSPVSPAAIATTAPSAPPADTPMMPGSAMGLRNSPCIVAPATPSAIPTEAPTMIRGSRICSITSCSVRPNSGVLKPMAESTIQATSPAEMSTGPRLSEIRPTTSTSASRTVPPIARRAPMPIRR